MTAEKLHHLRIRPAHLDRFFQLKRRLQHCNSATKNRKRLSFPRLKSPVDGGATGITLEMQHYEERVKRESLFLLDWQVMKPAYLLIQKGV